MEINSPSVYEQTVKFPQIAKPLQKGATNPTPSPWSHPWFSSFCWFGLFRHFDILWPGKVLVARPQRSLEKTVAPSHHHLTPSSRGSVWRTTRRYGHDRGFHQTHCFLACEMTKVWSPKKNGSLSHQCTNMVPGKRVEIIRRMCWYQLFDHIYILYILYYIMLYYIILYYIILYIYYIIYIIYILYKQYIILYILYYIYIIYIL